MAELFIFVFCRDSNFRDYISNFLLMDGHYVDSAEELTEVKEKLKKIHYDLILLSFSDTVQEKDLLLDEEIHKLNPDAEVVFLINSDKNIDKSLFSNVYKNLLIKPFILEDLTLVIKKIVHAKYLKKDISDNSVKNDYLKERRQSYRLKIELPIKYAFISPLGNIPSNENITKVLNLSQEGVMFKVESKVKLLDTVYLNILLPSHTSSINMIGNIIWDKISESEPWRYIGVQFSNINQKTKSDLASFISSKSL